MKISITRILLFVSFIFGTVAQASRRGNHDGSDGTKMNRSVVDWESIDLKDRLFFFQVIDIEEENPPAGHEDELHHQRDLGKNKKKKMMKKNKRKKNKRKKKKNNQIVPWGVAQVGGPIDYKGDNVIWVVDTGIDSNHEDLNVDKTRGWSYKMTNNTSDGREEYDTEDDNVGHGTAVAGVAAAKNNKKGVVGIAAGATVVPVKAMDMLSGYIDIYVVIQALWHVADNGSPGDVVVMSFSIVPPVLQKDCPFSIPSILENMDTALQNLACVVQLAQYEFETVLEEMATNGIKSFTSAGNFGLSNDSNFNIPSSFDMPNFFTIAASSKDQEIFYWSNYGKGVDYACPGVFNTTFSGNRYGPVAGTSFSTPLAAGLMLLDGMPDYELTTLGFAPNFHDTKLPDVPLLGIQPSVGAGAP